MASSAALDLVISVKGDADKKLGGLSASILGLGKNALGVGATLTKAIGGVALGGAIVGIGAVSAALVTGIGDAREAAQVMAATENVIKSMGRTGQISADQIAEMSASLSAAEGKSLFGDSDIQAGQNMLLTFANITDVLPNATQAMVDMTQFMGGDMTSSATMLGKALDNPTQGLSALSRVGVSFSETQKETIKTMQAAGNMAGAQGIILEALESQFGGAAEAAAKADGGFAQFKDRMGETAESLGTALLPAMNGLMNILNSDGVQNGLKTVADALGTGLQSAVSWLGATGLPALSTGFGIVRDTLSAIITPIQAATTAFNDWKAFGTEWGIVAVLQSIGDSFPLVEPFTTWLSDKVPGVFETARTTIADFKTGWDALKTAFEGEGIQGAFQLILDKVTELVPGLEPLTTWLGTTIPEVAATAQGWFISIVTRLQEWWDKIGGLQGVLDGFKTALDTLGGVVKAVTGFVNDHVAAQAFLVGVLTVIATRYALATIAAGAHAVATGAVTLALKAAAIAQGALNAVMTANPVGILIVAIAGLTAGLIYAYNNSETFRLKVDELWASFLRGITVIQEWAAGVKERLLTTESDFKASWERVTTSVSTAWETIKTATTTAFTSIVTTVSTKIDEVITFFTELPGRITTAIGSLGSLLVQAGKDVINGLIEGIQSIDVGSILGGIVSGAIATAKAAVGIKSPSTMARDELGRPLVDGIILGITDRLPHLRAVFADGVRDATHLPRLGQGEGAGPGFGGSEFSLPKPVGGGRRIMDPSDSDKNYTAKATATGRLTAEAFVQSYTTAHMALTPVVAEMLTGYFHSLRSSAIGPALKIMESQLYLGGQSGIASLAAGLESGLGAIQSAGHAAASAFLTGWGPPVLPAPVYASASASRTSSTTTTNAPVFHVTINNPKNAGDVELGLRALARSVGQ